MSEKCFDIGTIQAFLDGETAPEMSLRITNHVADCQSCAVTLAEAEEDSSFVFAALDREMNTLVPTQRLWSKINESIEVEKRRAPFGERLRNWLSVLIANPSLTVAASVLVVLGLFAAVWTLKPGIPADTEVAAVTAPQKVEQTAPSIPVARPEVNNDAPVITNVSAASPKRGNARFIVKANYTAPATAPKREAAEAVPQYLAGEETYVKTIAGLKQNVDGQKDAVLSPSSRIAYERDMAVVNDSITKMKKVVTVDPKNQSAKQLLFASYQNKIDLLNSVAERQELMASLK